ncbi:MAG: hypothetical protein JSU07_07500 [Bacteroidetes bacterium]|nr:hypothetical protein [Bacteroidota bacterium]
MQKLFAILFIFTSVNSNAQFDITKSYRGIVVEGMLPFQSKLTEYGSSTNNGALYTLKGGYAFGFNFIKMGYAVYLEQQDAFGAPDLTHLQIVNLIYQRKFYIKRWLTASAFAGVEYMKGYVKGQILPLSSQSFILNLYEQKPYENISFPFGAEVETLFKHNIAMFINTQYDASIKYSIFSASLGIRYQFIIKR